MSAQRNARASAMYAEYQTGLSLAKVAGHWNVTRQAVYSLFAGRGWKLRTRTLRPTVTYRGDTFSPDPDGYYRRTSGGRAWLHHVVWECHFGPIPHGHHIHHRDENKANNAIENLQLVTPAEHGRIHCPPEPIPERACLYCGKSLERKVYPSGRFDSPSNLRNRLYCDNRCRGLDATGRPRNWSPTRCPN